MLKRRSQLLTNVFCSSQPGIWTSVPIRKWKSLICDTVPTKKKLITKTTPVFKTNNKFIDPMCADSFMKYLGLKFTWLGVTAAPGSWINILLRFRKQRLSHNKSSAISKTIWSHCNNAVIHALKKTGELGVFNFFQNIPVIIRNRSEKLRNFSESLDEVLDLSMDSDTKEEIASTNANESVELAVSKQKASRTFYNNVQSISKMQNWWNKSRAAFLSRWLSI